MVLVRKNVYKDVCLFENVSIESVGVENVFVVRKRATMSILLTQKAYVRFLLL